jgi:cytoskeletal protein CcmA (bactofilin family)
MEVFQMEKETRHNLEILGGGSASGGSYHNVVIKGQGQINGGLDCDNLELKGVAEVDGDVRAKTVTVKGIAQIKGAFEAEEVEINGQTNIHGPAKVKIIEVEGFAAIDGSVSAEEVTIKGAIHIHGDCNAEVFVSKGAFTIDGLLNAGKIEISLFGGSKAREIGGGIIEVKPVGRFFGSLHKFFHTMFNLPEGLTVETIEGDDIYLEYTKAKVVRGSNVSVGPGCEIAMVEYKSNFQQAAGAKVTEQKKI